MIILSFTHGFFLGTILTLLGLVLTMIAWIIKDFVDDFKQYEKDRLPDHQETDATPDPDGD